LAERGEGVRGEVQRTDASCQERTIVKSAESFISFVAIIFFLSLRRMSGERTEERS